MAQHPSRAVTAGTPTPVDATCLKCRRVGLHAVVLYVMTPDGPRRVGDTTFCVCETRPAAATITTGTPRETGERCVRCESGTLYEVPFYAVTATGVRPHTTRVICEACDTRAAS